jgi:hypothetical protein
MVATTDRHRSTTEEGEARESTEALMTVISGFMHALMRWIDDKFGEEYDPY